MSLEGGWAGWEARFSLNDGKVVPVDDMYLPDSYKEWEVDVWGEYSNSQDGYLCAWTASATFALISTLMGMLFVIGRPGAAGV